MAFFLVVEHGYWWPARALDGDKPVEAKDLVGGAALAVMAFASMIAYRSVPRPPIRGRQEIVAADFVNHAKDPVFDLTLRKALEIELGQSPYLTVFAAGEGRGDA